mmetsp:Transcript_12974/g.19546  ORF Transcript_12974/g.19546 Transcript_12974/m.19546 type:complete len:601 (+) Transcript_12974:121-1923(+)|eukprot:CAMPEP_0185027614 /NCGR_PEP_ID=MMETSP1103-20130426/12876_1 /TAXON_ID=36769 /ORGANISM="Paraphysomonas bandaiensis, Strain Caron Lab Isolate" /LENGTH=600 /DNA_ID=CAMNT_0027561707 /DNA_START=48 /DNA_END=1850 /DNA_ORIENTATION=-
MSEETDILVYERKFFEVYSKYISAHPSLVVDPSQNLLTLCLEHLIPFSLWARKDEDTSTTIHRILMENLDLRPEVRNGLALIVIYVFSAAKKYLGSKSTDMFAVLLDSESGLGIVNKTSLKIYNDPFNYFAFIKCCISGLIYAKAIPENERQNRPKKARQLDQNTGEIESYRSLSSHLINLLNEGRHEPARLLVKQVLVLWQRNKSSVRDTRFKFAVAFLNAAMCNLNKSSSSQDLLSCDILFDEDDDGEVTMMDLVSGGIDLGTIAGKNHSLEGGVLSDPAIKMARTYSPPVGTTGSSTADSGRSTYVHYDHAHTAGLGNGNISHPTLQVLRLERGSATSWTISVSKVYSVASLLESIAGSPIYLVDEQMFPVEEWQSRRITRKTSRGKVNLAAELEARHILVTQWPAEQHDQLLHLIADWGHATRNSRTASSEMVSPTLISFWATGSLSMPSRLNAMGTLAYEVTPLEGLVVRASPELGLAEDVWRLMYSDDFVPPQSSHVYTYGDFLSALFPQISTALQFVTSSERKTEVTVKYASHHTEGDEDVAMRSSAPSMLAAAAYQTVGSLSAPASEVLARFDCERYIVHDILLVPCSSKLV